ncbi:MAG: M1 family metallopeptidase [Bacteroidia bacterium]
MKLLWTSFFLVWGQTIHHYIVVWDSLQFSPRYWQMRTGIIFSPQNASTLSLYLEGNTVDSVIWGVQNLSYTHTGNRLTISLPVGMAATDTLWVYYHGEGARDPQGFGGVYWGNDYVFNLGVSLNLVPHSYGRAWHPCTDTFPDKARYTFRVRVGDSLRAVCNGQLQSTFPHPRGGTVYQWELRDPLSAYLASFAVGKYAFARDTFIRDQDTLPILYAVRPSDSAAVYQTFRRLKSLLRGWESLWGLYPWERVGYVGVAFSSGAMEHATNIAYPSLILNGTNAYDYLWAHELSHSWFGDWVTCARPQEMWLNEGFATYSEALFYELFQGEGAYVDYMQKMHGEVLLKAHYRDGGAHALNAIPQNATYGLHSYQKGATVLHTLRYQLGDSAFWRGIRSYLRRYAHKVATSESLFVCLEDSLGIPLQDFLQGWVATSGHPYFQIDSVKDVGSWYRVYYGTRLRYKPAFVGTYAVPLLLYGRHGRDTLRLSLTAPGGYVDIPKPNFVVDAFCLNPWGHVADATTHGIFSLKSGSYTKSYLYATFTVQSMPVGDSGWVHVIHAWVPPADTAGWEKVPPRFWRVEGYLPPTAQVNMTLRYDGGSPSSLDYPWLNFQEDSLVVWYRPLGSRDWQRWGSYTVLGGTNLQDRRGSVRVENLQLGEYALGKGDPSLGQIVPQRQPEFRYQVGVGTIRWQSEVAGCVVLYDLWGRQWRQEGKEGVFRGLSSGVYFMVLGEKGYKIWVP